MASPVPPDPYVALGVSKDADISAIRAAHRKLALKYHPDRIKDEALREKGKDEFQKIQQAYEILSDPARRQRYDDQVRLAELLKETMMREPPPSTNTRTYPTRSAPQAATSQPREYNDPGNYFEEVRQPRDAYDYRDLYDEQPPRTTSRKYPDFERRTAPPPKASEKSRKPTGVWPAAMAAGKFKAQAEKIRNSKADEKRNDKEKRRERTDKAQTRRQANFEGTDSDSDDHPEIRPSMKSSRSRTTSAFDRPSERPRTSPRTERPRDFDEESFDEKWERHHEESKAYMAKATNRPSLDRNGSDAYQYWIGESRGGGGGRKSGSDNEKRPGSSKGRRTYTDDYFAPPFTKATSSPSNLRAHVEERAPPRPTTRERERGERERDHDRERDRERERERDRGDPRRAAPPGLHRSQTTPAPKVSSSSRKDTAPAKGSNLKHGETNVHDSGYGSSSSPHTPEMREESPPRSGKPRYQSTTSTKYQIVDQDLDADEYGRTPRVREVYGDDRSHRRYHRSPESIVVEPSREPDRRKERPERPRVDTNKKSSRGASLMQDFIPPSPTARRSESARYEERPSPRSPRDTPPISRNNSGREKAFAESPEERESSRYTRPYPADKVHITPRREPQYSQYEYREPNDRSQFREAPRMAPRRPSVNAY
ncbi:uncharacterized protein A1O5_04212 [Cladophialophora psammophila CBS 110553]|uniref:J domain-containing protein n=1 Tax=Cladophialophora psammophila CBS 110553 TaxID=1182543 RepID=W9WYN0_9EURO|nr:uncharacterized protein A1O5_04212 [Cladophialophora psammophila CBS 110553]EXJ73063.1 hypothetical protein A1O5_04212 [Cladophialophora psammophila CBS 110553]